VKNIGECLIRRVDQFGNDYDWKVAGSDGSALFKTRAEAIAFILKATITPMIKAYYDDKKPRDPFAPDDNDESLTHTGVSTPLHDGTTADDTDPFGNQRPRSLMSRHVESLKQRGRANVAGRKALIN